ncbi:hypothetical protein SAMN06264365_104522 [Actinoplanes regularis]|uniref:Uncharacterized protein n=1 Tax=Actinoplanes regularis TaxID=52697 RepID=A0A238YFF6_9ACTN|nr:hypothetical protein Are01nite_24070 [Actinoplanes regularis]SNR69955.1 hypothetical protein SAMN06264365_104522 [Actinoplanes regularis]
MIRVVERTAGTKPWDEAMSGWRSSFADPPTQLRSQRSDLLALVGRRLQAGWTGWDPARNVWRPEFPVVLVFEGGVQLELAWQKWNDLSITWNTVDLGTPPTVLSTPYEWCSSQPHPLAAVAGRTLTGWAVTESPYFDGETDLSGELPMDAVAGWSTQGLWIEFAGIGLHVYSGADANGISAEPTVPGDDGHTRVTHPQLPEDDAYVS